MRISDLLQGKPGVGDVTSNFHLEQRKDPGHRCLTEYFEHGELPTDSKEAQKVITQALHFAVLDGLLCFVDQKAGNR
jgi:hypothetical protein